MGLFTFLRSPDINEGVNNFNSTQGAVLLDVRTPEEFKEGHIPGSKNVPLQTIERVANIIEDKNTPIFVHCLSGGRSGQAASVLEKMGYNNVINIGGISAYRGKVER